MTTVDFLAVRRPRIVVLFDSAGFCGSRPLTGAAVRTERLAAHLYQQGAHVELLLCDLNPSAWSPGSWSMPVRYLRPDDVYSRPERLLSIVAGARPDVVVMATSPLLVRYGRDVAAAADAALVYEMHDQEAELAQQLGDPATAETALVQAAAVRAADAVVAFTERDEAAARRMGSAATYVLPCGVDPGPEPASAAPALGAEQRIVLLGNFFYEPNRRAAVWLHDVLAPLLPPGAVVEAIGRYPHELRVLSGRVRLRGPVPDVRAALDGATLAVAPLEAGGGMKLKLADYAAAGLPVVGTGEAFVGFPSPQEWAVCSPLEGLPEHVLRLLASPARQRLLGDRARRMVTSRFTWSDIAATGRDIYAEIAAAPRRGVAPSAAARRYAAAVPPYWLREWRSRSQQPATTGGTPR